MTRNRFGQPAILSIPGPPPTPSLKFYGMVWWALLLYPRFMGPTIISLLFSRQQIIRGLPYYYILSYPSPDPFYGMGPTIIYFRAYPTIIASQPAIHPRPYPAILRVACYV